jgi:hypothetical protein
VSEPVEEQGPIAFEAVHALPGFCRLVKRSSTLDGTLPLRAAQHCSPVFEANGAGFQVALEQPMTLQRSRGRLRVDMTPATFKQTQEEARGCVERLVRDGLLERNGYWHRLYREDALPIRGARIQLWSGFLVRPAPGVALRVGSAFNRRSRISVLEHAIVDRSGFTPLVIEIDGRDLGPAPRWLMGEIGCVLPVAPHAEMTLAPVRRAPEIVASFESFFDAQYFDTKKTKPTGKYRRMLRDHPQSAAAETCRAMVFYAGPDVHVVSAMSRFHGPAGITRQAPDDVALPYCTVTNVARVEAAWDGQTFTREKKALGRVLPSLERDWRRAGGNPSGDAYQFLSGYFIGPSRDEAYWLLQPWIFSVTPPGWSTVVDGAAVGGCDGMRGVIRTDQFHPISMVYRLYAPGPFVVPRRAPLIRFFPIPRRLQNAGMRVLE